MKALVHSDLAGLDIPRVREEGGNQHVMLCRQGVGTPISQKVGDGAGNVPPPTPLARQGTREDAGRQWGSLLLNAQKRYAIN